MDELTPSCNVSLPLWLIRRLPDLSNATLRIVLVVLAETTGWEAESAILSRADFADLSGLAQSSVQNGIDEALQGQLLQRVPAGMSYAYRLKAPTDSSAFPVTLSRNVTALRQLQRLQQRLAEQLEFERAVLERGPRHSFKAADGTPVRGDDRSAVCLNHQATTEPDRKTAPLPVADNEADRAPVELPDPTATQPLDLDRASVAAVDSLPVTSEPSHAPMHAGATRKNINNLFTLNHTHTVCEEFTSEHSARGRAREANQLSMFSYSEVLAYAESLKGIRNPGGLAVVYWRSGEMDAEIANFQRRQAERAERQAAEEAARQAEMRATAQEILARGEPFAEWERELIAAVAAACEEEHNVQIQRLDAVYSGVV